MTDRPIPMTWEGDGFRPASDYWQRHCDKEFVVHQRYYMVEASEASDQSRGHMFAALKEIYDNLPEPTAARFQNFDHFRKVGLIVNGFCETTEFPMADHEAAMRLAAVLGHRDSYAIITVSGSLVVEKRALSQRRRKAGGMDKATLQRSKQALLEWASDLAGVSISDAMSFAGKAA